VHSETKIFNLETHEFSSNLPYKKMSRHFHFGGQKLREQWIKKIKNLELFKIELNSGTPHKKTWNLFIVGTLPSGKCHN
jgi:hypothetical protein